MALTATAAPETQTNICQSLGLTNPVMVLSSLNSLGPRTTIVVIYVNNAECQCHALREIQVHQLTLGLPAQNAVFPWSSACYNSFLINITTDEQIESLSGLFGIL